MPPDTPVSALSLDIDWHALQANWRALDRLSGEARAGAAVKANAYGIGVRKTVAALAEAGCRDFFVAYASEADEICDLTDSASISVLHGPLTDEDARQIRAMGAKPVVNSVLQAQRWRDAGGGPCDVMVDTGINRLGLTMEDLSHEAIRALDVDILMSHLASADEDVSLNRSQLERWNAARAQLQHRRASLANSAGIALGKQYHGDLTRPGLSLYGGVPRVELEGEIRQVIIPQAAIMQVREIGEGDGIGYNSMFRAAGPMRIAAVAMGYADGYLRCWSNAGFFCAGEHRLPVLGRVSMDITMVDISSAPDLREGDRVSAEWALPAASEASGLSQYELLTLLGRRFAR